MVFEKKHDIDDLFIVITICIVAAILGIIGIYSLYKSYEAFIAYIGFIFLLYSTISLIYTFLHKSKYNTSEYNLNLGLDVTAIIVSLYLTVFFGIKSFYITYHHNNNNNNNYYY
tara:strand:+ start:399 stop:740 length:342 start_codon:yes stop_codon:yes gene_type:complete